MAGAGKGRARTPDRGETGRGNSRAPKADIPPPPPAPTRERSSTGAAPSEQAVKTEDAELEDESEYEEESEEEEVTHDVEIGLKAVPKAAAERPLPAERPEIPRRRLSACREELAPADCGLADRREDREGPRSSHRREVDEPRGRSRSRNRGRERRSSGAHEGPRKRRKRKRGNHRAGKKHQRLWRAHTDPFKRFHHRQPDSFWDRGPRD